MKAPLSYVPALPPAVGLIAGIVLGDWDLGIIGAIVGLLIFIPLYLKGKHYYAFFSLFIAIGSIMYLARQPNVVPEECLNSNHQYDGEVKTCEETTFGYNATVDINSCNSQRIPHFTILLSITGYNIDIRDGQKIAFQALLKSINAAAEVPYEINSKQYLRTKGIGAYATIDPGKILVIGEPSAIDNITNNFRNKIYNAIVDSPINGETAAFLVAAILGDDLYLLPETKNAFRAAGVSHILALSGLHVGILAALLAFMLAPLKLSRKGFYLQPLFTAIIIWLYAWLVGMGPSVTRAATMMSVFIAARMLQRDSSSFNSLCIALIICLCISPLSLFSAGFQLSFSAVLALLIAMPLIPDKLRRRPWLFYLVNMLVLPMAAMLGTGIVSAYYFHVFPLLFLPSNILAGILFPWIVTGGFVILMATQIGLHLSWLGWILDLLCRLLTEGGKLVYNLDFSVWKVPYFSAWAFLPYIAMIMCLGFAIYYRRKSKLILNWTYGVVGCFILAFGCAYFIRPSIPKAEFYIPTCKPQAIIMRYGDEAVLMPISIFSKNATKMTEAEKRIMLDDYNYRYSGFLKIRNCDEEFRLHTEDAFSLGPIYIENQCLILGDKAISIVNSAGIPALKSHYAMVCAEYAGDINSIVRQCNPDTILFSGDMSPMREKKLRLECSDSIPYISLRKAPFSIILK